MEFPKLSDPKLQDKILKKFSQYETPKKKPSFFELCYPEEFTYQLPQLFVSKFINPKTPYKGLLVYHRIGAGKTCAAIQIAEQWVDKRNVIFIVPASLVGNVYKEFRSECTGTKYITSAERNKLSKMSPLSKEYQDLLEKVKLDMTPDDTSKLFFLIIYNIIISKLFNDDCFSIMDNYPSLITFISYVITIGIYYKIINLNSL